MNYKKGLLAALLAPVLTLGSGALANVHAAGFAVFTHGASALGQGNAVTAHTDNPSTIFYNPALMNKLEGTQVQLGTTAIFSSREFESAATGATTSNDTVFFPSTFYATHKFNDSLSAGIGVFNPFGLGTEWDDDWEGRYQATESKLKTFNINPALSYRIIPSLAVAVGLDVVYADASLERKLPSTALGIPGPLFDIGQKFEGDGTGVGFNVGVAYDITKDIHFGASYRSQVQIDIKGDSSTSLAVTPLDGSGRTSIKLPPQVTAGIAYQVSSPLIVEAGVRWEGWSSFQELQLTLDNGTPLAPTPRDWHDSFGLNVGGKYRLNDSAAVSAGYVFGNSAVPDSTFDPSIPDAKTHVFCVGTDFNIQQANIALAYAYQMYEDRTKDNTIGAPLPANGEYRSDAHLVSVSLGYKF